MTFIKRTIHLLKKGITICNQIQLVNKTFFGSKENII